MVLSAKSAAEQEFELKDFVLRGPKVVPALLFLELRDKFRWAIGEGAVFYSLDS